MATRRRARRKIDALNDLASALIADGMFADAMDACIRSLRAEETPAAKALFVRLVKTGSSYDNAFVGQFLIRALSDPWCRTGQLVPASLALVRSIRVARQCIERAVASWPTALSKDELFGAEGLAALATDDLFRAVLENTPAADLDFEHFLALARRALLLDTLAPRSPDRADSSALRFCCAIARQCYINEYVYDCTAEENDGVASLRDAISKHLTEAKPVPGAWVAAFACYSPLFSLPDCQRLAAGMAEPPLAGLYSQQVGEILQELGHRADLQQLTPIDDATSRRVRSQYEEHPYPRWVRSPSIDGAVPFSAFLASELDVKSPRPARQIDNADVLIAGCGTGQQSIQTAQRFPAARILAVDLSAASLAYAKRKTREMRIVNIEYAQADILRLDSIGKTFDFIECVGVLHHLEDPMAGWRILRSLLRPGGVMHVGLYSALARRDIAAAQVQIVAQGYPSTTEGIRQFRRDLQLIDRWRPYRWLTGLEDFYDTSGCRDLLFHAKEHRFTIRQIEESLAELGLDFLKFNVDSVVQQRYALRFPGELARTDLNCWTQFEVENPNTFLGMYNFYAHGPA
ncbi:MAG: methyltransferase domain-containing protein [Betaproteobacteria bacterium]|nr:methyltransferase domain-containing protein [Betaproteobacteria bacterium]